jgi:hypothetical protein
VADIGRAPYGGDSLAGQTGGISCRGSAAADKSTVLYLFRVRNMFF